jgi:DNA-binding response OmpR family regulator
MDQDKDLAEAICATLRTNGHSPLHAADAAAVMEQFRQGGLDLLILDAATHSATLNDLMHAARHADQAIPVLLLSPRTAEDELMAALEAGANDYLVKPVRHGELSLRVQVLLRRAYPEQHAGESLRFGAYAFDTASSRIAREGKTIEVTQKEFGLALLFFRHLGRPLSRTYIRETIWPGESELPSRTLDTHVSRVRSKLGLRPENGYRLAPVYSFGYQLEQLSG